MREKTLNLFYYTLKFSSQFRIMHYSIDSTDSIDLYHATSNRCHLNLGEPVKIVIIISLSVN